jgi:small subunit ribosomal protein S13e
MGRMHAPGKGISSSALPYKRTPPSWMKTSPQEVVEQICKLAKKGLTPSQIGVVLRYFIFYKVILKELPK